MGDIHLVTFGDDRCPCGKVTQALGVLGGDDTDKRNRAHKKGYLHQGKGPTNKEIGKGGLITIYLQHPDFYSQKEMVCEFIKRKLRVRSDSNSFL